MAELSEYSISPIEQDILLAHRCVYLIGGVDSGKSTLALIIAKLFAAHERAAAVDLDAGQASIGVPTTFAWAIAGRNGLGRIRGMFFLGTTSPVGRFDDAASGAARLVADARIAVEKIVIDTCGLAAGELGRALHDATIAAVAPDCVILLERKSELDELAARYHARGLTVIRAKVPANVKKRSPEKRRRYRAGRLREYFHGAKEMTLPLGRVEIMNELPDPKGRIAGLRDKHGRDTAIGIVTKYSEKNSSITLLTPCTHPSNIHAVVLGTMRIARDGRQLGFNV